MARVRHKQRATQYQGREPGRRAGMPALEQCRGRPAVAGEQRRETSDTHMPGCGWAASRQEDLDSGDEPRGDQWNRDAQGRTDPEARGGSGLSRTGVVGQCDCERPAEGTRGRAARRTVGPRRIMVCVRACRLGEWDEPQ